jgi:O-antigen/teichoic acid export membrane protein
MNEPPSPDPRAILVVAGVLLSVLALLQVPRFNTLPVSIAVVTVGATLSTFFAHTHAYPGRMSIHLVPFAIAMTIAGAASAVRSTVAWGPPAGAGVAA